MPFRYQPHSNLTFRQASNQRVPRRPAMPTRRFLDYDDWEGDSARRPPSLVSDDEDDLIWTDVSRVSIPPPGQLTYRFSAQFSSSRQPGLAPVIRAPVAAVEARRLGTMPYFFDSSSVCQCTGRIFGFWAENGTLSMTEIVLHPRLAFITVNTKIRTLDVKNSRIGCCAIGGSVLVAGGRGSNVFAARIGIRSKPLRENALRIQPLKISGKIVWEEHPLLCRARGKSVLVSFGGKDTLWCCKVCGDTLKVSCLPASTSEGKNIKALPIRLPTGKLLLARTSSLMNNVAFASAAPGSGLDIAKEDEFSSLLLQANSSLSVSAVGPSQILFATWNNWPLAQTLEIYDTISKHLVVLPVGGEVHPAGELVATFVSKGDLYIIGGGGGNYVTVISGGRLRDVVRVAQIGHGYSDDIRPSGRYSDPWIDSQLFSAETEWFGTLEYEKAMLLAARSNELKQKLSRIREKCSMLEEGRAAVADALWQLDDLARRTREARERTKFLDDRLRTPMPIILPTARFSLPPSLTAVRWPSSSLPTETFIQIARARLENLPRNPTFCAIYNARFSVPRTEAVPGPVIRGLRAVPRARTALSMFTCVIESLLRPADRQKPAPDPKIADFLQGAASLPRTKKLLVMPALWMNPRCFPQIASNPLLKLRDSQLLARSLSLSGCGREGSIWKLELQTHVPPVVAPLLRFLRVTDPLFVEELYSARQARNRQGSVRHIRNAVHEGSGQTSFATNFKCLWRLQKVLGEVGEGEKWEL